MSVRSVVRVVVPYFALVSACGAALVFGMEHVRHEPPFETEAATGSSAISPPASAARQDQGSAPAITAAPALAIPPRSPDTNESAPAFDIARIERTGEAVIAGRAAPGSIVELMRNGEPHDRVVADQSGQFVMVPPRLPPGDYELTLRSTQPDGKQTTSKQSVEVALDDSGSGADRSRAEETLAANRSVPDQAVGRQAIAVSQPPHATATPLSGGDSPSPVAVPRIASAVVSRGDSLWRISRAAYGAGVRYTVVYKANRDHIRDPNRIYPGQIFVLPMKAR